MPFTAAPGPQTNSGIRPVHLKVGDGENRFAAVQPGVYRGDVFWEAARFMWFGSSGSL